MQIIKASFDNYELYKDSVSNWDLDFRLLSKNDFYASLNMFMSESFSLTRTSLNGKIEQYGQTPMGFRSIVIPINYLNEFVWLNKKVSGNNLLVFPKNGVLDAISFYNFDVFVISIEESMLENIINDLGYNNCKKLFKGDEQIMHLSKGFAQTFYQVASTFLNTNISDKKRLSAQISNIIHFILNYIEYSTINAIPSTYNNKKEVALKKAIDIINNQDNIVSIQQLCAITNVSERSLQYAFKDKYQVSPWEYIKSIRLNRVKNELHLLGGKDISIADLAAKHNFWHMGQFAKDFKNQFGLLPSEIRRQ